MLNSINKKDNLIPTWMLQKTKAIESTINLLNQQVGNIKDSLNIVQNDQKKTYSQDKILKNNSNVFVNNDSKNIPEKLKSGIVNTKL